MINIHSEVSPENDISFLIKEKIVPKAKLAILNKIHEYSLNHTPSYTVPTLLESVFNSVRDYYGLDNQDVFFDWTYFEDTVIERIKQMKKSGFTHFGVIKNLDELTADNWSVIGVKNISLDTSTLPIVMNTNTLCAEVSIWLFRHFQMLYHKDNHVLSDMRLSVNEHTVGFRCCFIEVYPDFDYMKYAKKYQKDVEKILSETLGISPSISKTVREEGNNLATVYIYFNIEDINAIYGLLKIKGIIKTE
jgi:hypothetical protein